jgi:hypothetical protein
MAQINPKNRSSIFDLAATLRLGGVVGSFEPVFGGVKVGMNCGVFVAVWEG